MSATPSAFPNPPARNGHSASPTPNDTANGRDSRGRFAPGNAGGPGNPYNRRVAELRRIMLEEISDDKLRSIIQMLLSKAEAGDLAAIKLVLQYGLGKPTPAPDPDAVDQHEWQLQQQAPGQMDVLEKIADGIPTATACQVVREMMPIVASCHLQSAGQIISGEAPPPEEQARQERKRRRRERDEREERELAEFYARQSAAANGGNGAGANEPNGEPSSAAPLSPDALHALLSQLLRE